uniref:AAA family ATPase n=1 Tax=Caldimicrobium thiodismutans TaxID=1653476 RepID=A0A832GPZ1_9BACT
MKNEFSMKNEYSYLEFFKFKAPPFYLVPDPNLFYPSRAHTEALEVLTYGIYQGSLITVLTGEPGLGKTQVLLTLLSRLSEEILPIHIFNPALSPEEFFKSLFHELSNGQLDSPLSKAHLLNKNEILKLLKAFFAEALSQPLPNQVLHRRYLLIFDEAQLLPPDTLEELRLLTNLNEGTELCVQLLLIGQPGLAEKLKSKELSPLRQRISVWEELRPLERDEVLPYIWFRIKEVSEKTEILLDKKIEKPLYKASRGIPRVLNKIMDRALLVGYVKKQTHIKKDIIKEALRTLRDELV